MDVSLSHPETIVQENTMKRRVCLFGALAVLAILLAACANPAQPTPTPQPEISPVPLAPTAQLAATIAPQDVAKPLPTEVSGDVSPETEATMAAIPTPPPTAEPLPPAELPTVENVATTVDGPISDFENGSTSGWHISGAEYKTTDLSVAQVTDAKSQFALMVTSVLRADPEEYASIEAWIDFGRALRQGVDQLGPEDLNHKTITCWVKLPKDYADKVGVRLYVKDSNARNNWGPQLLPGAGEVNNWQELRVRVGDGDFDPGFDGSQTNTVGVRVDLYQKGAILYNPFFIDDCAVSAN